MQAKHYMDTYRLKGIQRIHADDQRIPSNAVFTQNMTELDRIREQDKNILIFHWEPSSQLLDAVSNVELADIPHVDELLKARELDSFFSQFACHKTKQVLSELRPFFTKLHEISSAKRYRFTMAKVTDQMCPLFHVDRVQLRMLVTIVGPGTEWVADCDVNRKHLGKGSNNKIVKPGVMIQQLLPLQIAYLKGELFPFNLGHGIVHRSPAVAPESGGRWFIRLDAISS